MKFLNNIPRWLVIQTDLILCGISLILAYFLRHNFEVPSNYWYSIWISLGFVLTIKFIAFLLTKSYAGIIQYTSIEDAKRIFYAITLSLIPILIANYIITRLYSLYFIPFGVILIDYFISMFFMASFRICSKIMYYENKNNNSQKIDVIIYGAGEAGSITKKTLLQDETCHYNIVAFIDDNKKKSTGIIDGIHIFHTSELQNIVEKHDVALLIIAIQNLPFIQRTNIVESCLLLDIKMRTIPPVENWINGELSNKQIKDVAIEDILERPTIKIENPKIKELLYKNVILVTGAAGSIGSELVRQIVQYNPQLIILYDQAETPLYELENELIELPFNVRYEAVIGDVTNIERVDYLFKKFKPKVVYHAAAYKHVPLMEDNPAEAISVNINGTKILADLSVKYKVDQFLMVSTDKAVNPTNVMGASKRVAEIYCQAMNGDENVHTSFIITRFGNVLGSNGSVIPRFKKQIAEGGPITLTHPDITRFFMTIPEAAQLVLEASNMGKGGEIFVFDMGKSVKIMDLAKKMIALSGLKVGKDIQIVHTGLRPGEKLYEEVLADPNNVNPTYHSKIMIGKPEHFDLDELKNDINQLITFLYTQNNRDLVKKLKQIIPEFKSKNSTFEELD